MKKISEVTGREYAPFTYYGASKMLIELLSLWVLLLKQLKIQLMKWLNLGEKVGLVKVHLYRPFSAKYLLKVLPASAKKSCGIRSYKRTRICW